MAPPIRRPKVDAPHVGQVADRAAQQSLAEVWKRIQLITDRHDTLQRSHDDLHTSVIRLGAATAGLSETVAANAVVARRQAVTNPGGGAGGGGGTGGGTDDSGQGVLGLNAAGPTGHVTTGSPLTPFTAGQIVGGVGNEFPGLLAIAANDAARVAQRYEIIGRMIWHLNQAGFSASRYTITFNAYHLVIDNLVNGLPAAYRVISYGEYPVAYTTMMEFEEASARLGPGQAGTSWPDGGTPD